MERALVRSCGNAKVARATSRKQGSKWRILHLLFRWKGILSGMLGRCQQYVAPKARTWLDCSFLPKGANHVQVDCAVSGYFRRSVADRNGHRDGGCDRIKGQSPIQNHSGSQFRAGVSGERARNADGAADVDGETDAARRGR